MLSKRSRCTEAEESSAQAELGSSAPSDSFEQLHTQVEELKAQNADLLLKVQVLCQTHSDLVHVQTQTAHSHKNMSINISASYFI